MNKRRPPESKNANDFNAARARLKHIGQGLSSIFETVSRLVEEAAEIDDTKAGDNASDAPRLAAAFDVRVGTVDDLVNKPAPRAVSQPKYHPQSAMPIVAESFVSEACLVVVVTLGTVPADAIEVVEAPSGLALHMGQWRYFLNAPHPLEPAPIARVERNGFLTLVFAFAPPPGAPAAHIDTQ